MSKRIGMVVGSLRRGSFSRQVADNVRAMFPQGMDVRLVEIGDLPMYNQDLDDGEKAPAEWTRLREAVKALDGVVFITPEYNRSVPPVLKNAIDIASRPYGKNAWDGKPGAVLSVSPGKIGAFGANHHLRQSLTFLNVLTMQQPEAYLGGVADALDAEGKLKPGGTKDFLQGFVDAFVAWMGHF